MWKLREKAFCSDPLLPIATLIHSILRTAISFILKDQDLIIPNSQRETENFAIWLDWKSLSFPVSFYLDLPNFMDFLNSSTWSLKAILWRTTNETIVFSSLRRNYMGRNRSHSSDTPLFSFSTEQTGEKLAHTGHCLSRKWRPLHWNSKGSSCSFHCGWLTCSSVSCLHAKSSPEKSLSCRHILPFFHSIVGVQWEE